MPGFIDFHCHLREPGFEVKETIATGSKAALSAIYYYLLYAEHAPAAGQRGDDCDGKNIAERDGMIQVLPIGCVTQGRKGKALIYMEPLVKAGVVGSAMTATRSKLRN